MANQHLNLNSECLNLFSAPFRRCGRHVFQNHLKTQEAFIKHLSLRKIIKVRDLRKNQYTHLKATEEGENQYSYSLENNIWLTWK